MDQNESDYGLSTSELLQQVESMFKVLYHPNFFTGSNRIRRLKDFDACLDELESRGYGIVEDENGITILDCDDVNDIVLQILREDLQKS